MLRCLTVIYERPGSVLFKYNANGKLVYMAGYYRYPGVHIIYNIENTTIIP